MGGGVIFVLFVCCSFYFVFVLGLFLLVCFGFGLFLVFLGLSGVSFILWSRECEYSFKTSSSNLSSTETIPSTATPPIIKKIHSFN